MAKELPPLIQKFLDKFSNSRDFTISFTLHAIIIAIFSGTVLFQAVKEPPDFEGGDGGFVQASDAPSTPPTQQVQQQTEFNVTTAPSPASSSSINSITTTAVNPMNFSMAPTVMTPVTTAPSTTAATTTVQAPTVGVSSDGLTRQGAAQIKAFTGGWGKGKGVGTGVRSREFEFTAYLGQYAGGDWNSTVRVVRGKIETGSLPNLLYLMSFWSKDKIKTNYKNVQAIKLDSDEIFKIKPPFIFMTGTQDFKLTEKEVDTLRKYVRLGGCIWGDSSLPGLRSRFDIAFRREMRRVIPDVDKDFEPLPDRHPIFTDSYFADVKSVPPGLNYYQEPVFALKIYGEIAILYTANDYGDMWQVGLNKDGDIDLRRDQRGNFIAVNRMIFENRNVYLRNISPESLATSFRFGTNVVIHLLTRWENKVSTAPTL